MDAPQKPALPRGLVLACVAVVAIGLAEMVYYVGVYRPRQRLEAQERVRAAEEARLARARGGLLVATVPPGAEVAVGDRIEGKSPLALRDLKLGRYPVVVRLAGYEEQQLEAQVREDTVAALDVALVRSTGSARVESSPPGLAFDVTGAGSAAHGTTPATLGPLPTGDYLLAVHREGWPDQTRTLTVARNASASARVAFAGGSLEITSVPPGAEVWLQAKKLGATPLWLDGLAPGGRDLELRLEGYRAFAAHADVRAGGAARVAAALLVLPPPAPGMPWVNSLGMRFVPVAGTRVLFSVWDTRVQDFEAFVKATGYDATADMYSLRLNGWQQRGDTWRSPGFAQGPTCPVCGVSWNDAKAYCAWLTRTERAEGRLGAGQEYRLPTDAEWSVAVGLDEGTEGTPHEKSGQVSDVYPWGTQFPPPRGAGNYAGTEARDAGWPASSGVIAGYNDGYPRTSPVGSFAANKFGLYDMGGNVWQWCEDAFDASPGFRVLRGASFSDDGAGDLLSSTRFNFAPAIRYDVVGFRCVVTVAPEGRP